MSAQVAFNPYVSTNAAGTFSKDTVGLIQGTAWDQPAIRYSLEGGYLASTESLPMWGGVAIYEDVPTPPSPNGSYGGAVGRAPVMADITGFSVFDQMYAAVNSPQSPVPLIGSGGSVNFYRLGSGARIAVACVPGLVDAQGNLITQQVSWDLVNQQLIPFAGAYTETAITNAVWANTDGGQTTYTVGADLTADLSAGDYINVAGVVNTGGSSTTAFNGSWQVVSVTSTTVVVSAPASASLGTYASGGNILAGGGALNVRILKVQPEGCMTVEYNAETGFATWNRDGSAAVILI